jgi:hypothetical protein
MRKLSKQLSIKMLVIYMISALLFLTSIELHIHTKDAASSADHGFAVSISSLSSEPPVTESHNEITVSPEGLLKISQVSFSVLAIFLFIALMALFARVTCISRLREINALSPLIPFYGAPSLRAPPL